MTKVDAHVVRAVALGGVLWALSCSTSGKPSDGGAAGKDASGHAGTGGRAGTGVAGADAAAGSAAIDAAAGSAAIDAAAGSTATDAAGATDATDASDATDGAMAAEATGAAGIQGTDTPQSVLTRNKHETRDGFYLQPTLTKAMAAKMAPDATFTALFPGSLTGSPLYAEKGPAGKGVFVTATNDNVVYALDETTGAVVWMHSIGVAPAQTGVPCGNVKPVGITSTPVIDGVSRTIYVAGAVTVAGSTDIGRHEIHALSLDDGSERAGWPVDVSPMTAPGGLAFSAKAQNQRGALSLVNGVLYVPYGGHGGDCGVYHGWVIAVNTKDPTQTGAWATAGIGEGIWAGGGMASDGNGVIAVTGNRLGDTWVAHQDSEQVVRVTGLGAVDRTTGVYFPNDWRLMDIYDWDFGSSSPLVVRVPGATPSTLVIALSKPGHLYLLDAANLGGMGGHVQDLAVVEGNAFWSTPAAYTSSTGVHVIFNAFMGLSCGQGIASFVIVPGSPPKAQAAWCAPTTGKSSPIATSTDGQSETIVWFMSGDVLKGVDGATGALLFDGGAGTCTGVPPWSSPIAVKGRIVVGGNGHLCSWSPH